MPAWVERDAKRVPLAPGMELKGGDELRTGAGARIYVKLSEGSLVQLGENASLRLQDLAPQRDGLVQGDDERARGRLPFHHRCAEEGAAPGGQHHDPDRDGRNPRHRPVGQIDRGPPDRLPDRGQDRSRRDRRSVGDDGPAAAVLPAREGPDPAGGQGGRRPARRVGEGDRDRNRARRGAARRQMESHARHRRDAGCGAHGVRRGARRRLCSDDTAGEDRRKDALPRAHRATALEGRCRSAGGQLRGKYGVAEPKVSG